MFHNNLKSPILEQIHRISLSQLCRAPQSADSLPFRRVFLQKCWQFYINWIHNSSFDVVIISCLITSTIIREIGSSPMFLFYNGMPISSDQSGRVSFFSIFRQYVMWFQRCDNHYENSSGGITLVAHKRLKLQRTFSLLHTSAQRIPWVLARLMPQN